MFFISRPTSKRYDGQILYYVKISITSGISLDFSPIHNSAMVTPVWKYS